MGYRQHLTARILLGILLGLSTVGSAQPLPPIAVLPQPASLTQQPGVFTLKRDTAIVTDVDTAGAGQLLAQALNSATKFGLRARSGTSAPDRNTIVITTDRTLTQLGEEGYQLEVTPTKLRSSRLVPMAAEVDHP